MSEGVEVFMLVRGRSRRLTPADDTGIKAGDILLIEGEPAALDRLVDKAGLKLAREETEQATDTPHDEIGVMEAVVGEDSPLVGRTAGAGEARRALRRASARGQPARQAHHPAHARGAAREG